MTWRSSLFLFLSCLSLFGQSRGQISGVNINPNGWVAEVYVYLMATNGNFNYGFAGSTNNVYSTTNFALTLTSMGYDDLGQGTTVVRTIPATKTIRFPYPSATLTNRIITNADWLVIYCALADFVSSKDSNITANFAASWYADATGGNLATNGLVCTNASLQTYGKVLAQWSDVPYQIVTNPFTLKCVAFHRSVQHGRPVRAVKFWSKDQDGNTNEPVVVNTLSLVTSDVVTSMEYIATMSCSNFTSKKTFTNYFAAYPWVGDPDSVWDSSDTNLAWFHTNAAVAGPFNLTCNRSNDYGFSYAVVDTNSQTAGIVVSNSASLSTPFSNWVSAINAVALSNFFWYGRSNHGGSFIYLTNGPFAILSAAVTARARPSEWCVTTRHPNCASNEVMIYTNNIASCQNDILFKFSELTITNANGTAATAEFLDGYVWLDQVWKRTNTGAGALSSGCTNVWVTRCLLEHQNLNYASANEGRTDRHFFRGNRFTGKALLRQTMLVMGNLFQPDTNAYFLFVNDTSGAGYVADPYILCYNKVFRMDTLAGGTISIGKQGNILLGAAIVQNVFEQSAASQQPFLEVGQTTAATPDATTNVLVWHNTIVGQRYLNSYNDTTNRLLYSFLHHHRGNVSDEYATKHDNHPTQYAERTNRWAVLYSVGHIGDAMAAVYGGGSYFPEDQVNNFGFNGISVWDDKTISTNQVDGVFGWTRPAAQRLVAGAGAGDYTPTNTSVLRNLVLDLVLPYDLAGYARSSNGTAGAFEYQSPAEPATPSAGRRYRFRWGF